MKTIKVNQTILFGILGFLFLSIITHYLIHNLDNKKTTEIQVKAFDIDEKTRQINDKLDGLDMSCPECPEQKDCPICKICDKCEVCPKKIFIGLTSKELIMLIFILILLIVIGSIFFLN